MENGSWELFEPPGGQEEENSYFPHGNIKHRRQISRFQDIQARE